MRIPTLALVAGIGLTLAGCGDKDSEDTAATDGTDGGSDGSTDGADGSSNWDGTDGTEEGTASLSGTVRLANGSAAAGLQMRLCYELCLVADTDASGNFVFDGVQAHDGHLLQAVSLGQLDTATPHMVINLAEDEQRTLTADITTTAFSTWETMGSGSNDYALDGGLTVFGAAAADLTYGSYTPDPTQDFVASVRMDPASAGLTADGLPSGSTVVALWYLANFDATIAADGWSFKVDEDFELSQGDQVYIYATDNVQKGWTAGGTATVGSDGTITSDAASGIPLLTTMVLVTQ